MKSLQIRDTPVEVYELVAKSAKEQGRSLSQQALVLIAKGAGIELNAKARRRKLLSEFRPIQVSKNFNATALVREDRSR